MGDESVVSQESQKAWGEEKGSWIEERILARCSSVSGR